jgi:hypothetical protein
VRKAISRFIYGDEKHERDMTNDAEHEMHAILLSCKRARKQMLAALPAKNPSLH